jgi:hypothetical protein
MIARMDANHEKIMAMLNAYAVYADLGCLYLIFRFCSCGIVLLLYFPLTRNLEITTENSSSIQNIQ